MRACADVQILVLEQSVEVFRRAESLITSLRLLATSLQPQDAPAVVRCFSELATLCVDGAFCFCLFVYLWLLTHTAEQQHPLREQQRILFNLGAIDISVGLLRMYVYFMYCVSWLWCCGLTCIACSPFSHNLPEEQWILDIFRAIYNFLPLYVFDSHLRDFRFFVSMPLLLTILLHSITLRNHTTQARCCP